MKNIHVTNHGDEWEAFREGYALGDPTGLGSTPPEAIASLKVAEKDAYREQMVTDWPSDG